MSSTDAVARGPLNAVTFGAASATDRRARWHRQASLTTMVGIAARVIAIAARLVTIPLALHLLGVERYGLWLSVGSVLAWLTFAGPGLGYGLINAISEAVGHDDTAAVRRYVSTGILAVGGVGVLLLMLVPFISRWDGWPAMLGIANRPDLVADASALISVSLVLCVMSLAFESIGPVCAGLQQGYLSSLAAMTASLLTVGGVVLLAMHGGTLVTFALVVGVPGIVANAGLAVYLFWRRYPALRPSWRRCSRDSARTLAGFGGWMLVLQLGDLAIFQSANILIANHFGPGAVPRFAVPAALFTNIAQLCYLVVQPYWPALKEASVRGDWTFVRSTTAHTLKIRMAIMLASALVILAVGPAFIRVWAGEGAVPSRSLLLAMSVYYLLVTISGNFVVLLLAFGAVRLKALLSLAVGVAHVVGFLLLSPYVGVMAIPLAGGLAVFLECLVTSRVAARRIGRGMSILEQSSATA